MSSDRHLTSREAEILQMVAEGQTNKAIATRLGISEATVAHHLHNVFLRLGVSSRAAAVSWFERNVRGQSTQEQADG